MPIFYKKIGRRISVEERRRAKDLSWKRLHRKYGNPHADIQAVAADLCFAHSLLEVRRIYYQVIRRKRHTRNLLSLANLAISVFGKWGSVAESKQIFDGLWKPSETSYRKLFQAYVGNGYLDEAKQVFLSCPEVTVQWWCEMMAAYARFGYVEETKQTFDWMPEKDSTAWMLLLTAYAHNGYHSEAKKVLKTMPDRGSVAANTLLTGYALAGKVEKAKKLFDYMKARTAGSWNSLAQAYALGGHLQESLRVFCLMPMTTLASWTGMINTYGRYGLVDEAEKVFAVMPAIVAAPCNALLGAYTQNGHMRKAKELFQSIGKKDRVSWKMIMEGFVGNGRPRLALSFFHMMNRDSVAVDRDIFKAVLNACRQLGEVETTREYFRSMIYDFELSPGVEHYCCVLEVMARASPSGLEDAEELINNMPFKPHVSEWRVLLDACQAHKDSKRAARVVQEMVKLDPKDHSPYLTLANIYFRAGQIEEVVRLLSRKKRLYKDKETILKLIVESSIDPTNSGRQELKTLATGGC